MDIQNYMWLGKHQKVVVAFNQLLDVLKALASVVLFTKVVSLNHGAHSAINHHDALVKYVSYAAVDWHFETCAELGLQNTLLLLSGYLTETQEDHKTNLEYLEKYQVFALGPVITAVNLNISGLVIYKGAPLYNILHNEYPEQDYNSKFWTYPKNPTLTLNERVRRATELTYTATRLGFNILHFESRINELRQLQHMLKETTQQKILPIFPLYNTHEHIG